MHKMHKAPLTFLAVLFLTTLVYWPGLDGPLLFDDHYNLAPLNEWLRGERGWEWVVLTNRSGMLGRPISMASLVLNVALTGDSIWGLKLGNLILHLLTGGLVFALFSKFARLPAVAVGTPEAVRRWLPCLGAAIWVVHPLFVSTVLYVIQRMAMLSTFFMLLGMLAYVCGRIRLDTGKTRSGAVLTGLIMPLCTVLAALSKENGILLPPLCALIELLVFVPDHGKRRHWLSRCFLICFLLIPAILAVALTLGGLPQIVDGYQNRPFTLTQRLLTEGRVLWSYVSTILVPFGPRLGLYHDDFPLSQGLFNPLTTALAIFAWLGVIILAWRSRRAIPGFGLGVGLYLVGHALESTVFPLLIYFEHRNYLPGIGVIWAFLSLATWAGSRLSSRLHHPAPLFAASAVALVAVLAVVTAARAGVWQTRAALLAQGINYHPQSRWLRMDLLIDNIMVRDKPDFPDARYQVDILARSASPSTRRLAATSALLVDCIEEVPASGGTLAAAFDGRANSIEADHLLTVELLANKSIEGCTAIPPVIFAPKLEQMLSNSRLPADNFYMYRLRFATAKLYIASGDERTALSQARLAYSGKRGMEPIGLLLAQLELAAGNREAAWQTISRVNSNLLPTDYIGHEIVQDFMGELARGTPVSEPSTPR